MRALLLLAFASVIVVVAVVLTRDPDEAWAVGAVIVSGGVAAGAIATMLQLRGEGKRNRAAAARRGVASRRGIEVGAVVAVLLWLRAIDGLSALTASFVVGAFVVAEAILSARPESSR